MAIRILVCGGTFDKQYDEITGRLYFENTHVPEMLRLGRCRVDLQIDTLMMIDSLEMTDADRARISEACRRCAESQIVVTHGTDTMVETAATLARLRQFGWPLQPWQRVIVCPGTAGGRLRGDERDGVSVEPRSKEPPERGVRGR
jgi:hypothetical protein